MKQVNIEEFKKSPHIGGYTPKTVDDIILLAKNKGLLTFLEEMSYGDMKSLKAKPLVRPKSREVYLACSTAMRGCFDETIRAFENQYTPSYANRLLDLLVDSVYAGKHGVKALEKAKTELESGIGNGNGCSIV